MNLCLLVFRRYLLDVIDVGGQYQLYSYLSHDYYMFSLLLYNRITCNSIGHKLETFPPADRLQLFLYLVRVIDRLINILIHLLSRPICSRLLTFCTNFLWSRRPTLFDQSFWARTVDVQILSSSSAAQQFMYSAQLHLLLTPLADRRSIDLYRCCYKQPPWYIVKRRRASLIVEIIIFPPQRLFCTLNCDYYHDRFVLQQRSSVYKC